MEKKTKMLFGKKGEDVAVKYLTRKKYEIIARNYHSQFGEIDIIALKNNELIFFEVKTRKSNFESAFSSVSISKQKKISKTALCFLSKNNKYDNFLTRFDVIALIYDQKKLSFEIKQLKNAFTPILF